ncbi:hypothetical protein [Bowmanella dokdonensis]|uniref:Lipoprotein n=1 Tax=Bowmanella dokdonensis TaxID=751969 RepID=A0A939DMN4_9ALTE|nr:hypothetical protein [Bowmanella dokdonensis]MBN7825410.1 hypothetical protein [Bowmanella dokdonensis]
MTLRTLTIAAAIALLGGCASTSQHANLEHLSETERNKVLNQCADTPEGDERQACIARHAPKASEEGQTCERVKVTGSRFGARVCTPTSQAQD